MPKLFLQILVIIFAGQILSLIIAKFNRNRQGYIVLNDYRKSFLDKINKAFVNSQKARRKLRTEGIAISQEETQNDSRNVKIIALIKQMESINEIEFELRAMVDELRTFQCGGNSCKVTLLNDSHETQPHFCPRKGKQWQG